MTHAEFYWITVIYTEGKRRVIIHEAKMEMQGLIKQDKYVGQVTLKDFKQMLDKVNSAPLDERILLSAYKSLKSGLKHFAHTALAPNPEDSA
jgi:hypothetical protein